MAGSEFDYDTIYIPTKRKNFDPTVAKLVTNAKVNFHEGPMLASFSVNKINMKNKAFNHQFSQNLKQQVTELLNALDLGLSLTEKVKKYILSIEKPAMLSIERAAEFFGMSQTTFRRQLKDEGQNFKSIQSEILGAIALKVLSTTTMKIEEFAQYIGYAERSSFERFFKSKFGVSPAKYRKVHQLSK